ncbi:inorganic phosphate transporter [Fervidibacillus albus]|uniref:Inorganic phosphate transporter n=1 Tax=Fervidibacillus albus TaxID=2980026 RepID=A0A9E8LSQ2_9BACI|nr:inorganic phosphate transporter [Fervidibacillus albus]WAA08893.1 inorganic phosphate transporter [Fervidibacillus albus]
MLSFSEFFAMVFSNPIMFVTVLLALGVVLVNGWTDAPNAIATCVSTKCIGVRSAIILAAVMNFLGVVIMTMINSTVAQTIYNMVDFSGDAEKSIIALCAALFAIVLWATAAWYFGIPTSESHALIAGLTGAAIALQGGLDGVNGAEWMKIIYGILLSTLMGFGLGYVVIKAINFLFRNVHRRKAENFFHYAEIAASSGMAFMHGAQDGQKFIGMFLFGIFLSQGITDATTFEIPIWVMILISVVISFGTSIGGYRIIKSVGMDMVKLSKHEGFAADFTGMFSLLTASLFGLPVSTTHTKTTAIMGIGASKRLSNVNWLVVRDMVLAWILTFPGCGLIGYLMAKLFFILF